MFHGKVMLYSEPHARFRYYGVWGEWFFFADIAKESWSATGWDAELYRPEDDIDPTDYTEGAD